MNVVRKMLATGCTTVLVTIGLAVNGPSASAAPLGDIDALKNDATGRCIDDSFAYGLRAFDCNNLRFQSWLYSNVDSGWIDLKSKETGRCIDDSFAYGLRAYPCNRGVSFQSWKERWFDGNKRTFQNRATGRCIDDSFAYGLRAFDCNNQAFQKFGRG